MRAGFYFAFFLLIIPFQAALLTPLSIAGIQPDLALALLYGIGLLTGPIEAALVGVGVGLLLDIGAGSLIGITGFTRGAVGLCASLLGKKVLDMSSPSNGIFLVGFSLAEGLCLAFFIQIVSGDVPFFSLMVGRVLPRALYTGALGIIVLRLLARKNILAVLMRRTGLKEL